jgi:hypothetical protein
VKLDSAEARRVVGRQQEPDRAGTSLPPSIMAQHRRRTDLGANGG